MRERKDSGIIEYLTKRNPRKEKKTEMKGKPKESIVGNFSGLRKD